jgi:hypothetical protein
MPKQLKVVEEIHIDVPNGGNGMSFVFPVGMVFTVSDLELETALLATPSVDEATAPELE